jgi:adenylate cyclase
MRNGFSKNMERGQGFRQRLANNRATMRRIFRQPTLIMLFCLLVAALTFAVAHTPSRPGWLDPAGALERAELYTLDQRFLIRGPRTPRSDIAVITIDGQTLEELGGLVQMRAEHAELVRRLVKAGATALAFDVIFDLPTTEEYDRPFETALRLSTGQVFLACMYEEAKAGRTEEDDGEEKGEKTATIGASGAVTKSGPDTEPEGDTGPDGSMASGVIELNPNLPAVPLTWIAPRLPEVPQRQPAWLGSETKDSFWAVPLPRFSMHTGVGLVDMPRDADQVYRRVRLVQAVNNGRMIPHLSLAVVAHVLGVAPSEIRATERTIKVGSKLSVPLDPDGTFAIDYAGGPATFDSYSYARVLGMSDAALRKEFHDKILYIGATAMGLNDLRPIPYNKRSAKGDGTNYGVFIHANLTDALLQNRFFYRPSWMVTAVIMLLIALYLGRVLAVYPMWEAIGASALLAAAYGLLGVAAFQGLFWGNAVLLPMAAPIFSMALNVMVVMTYRFRVEYNERRRYRDYLGRYMSKQVAAQLENNPELAKLGAGERREVTCLFSDIRGFTSMSEQMAPENVAAMLCRYFSEMVAIVDRYEGNVNNFVGDALVALWNAPLDQPDHARRAVLAALGMLSAWTRLQEEWRAAGHPSFRIGIGINSGEVFWGNIGEKERQQFTMIGDTVNAAARLEALNKEMGTSLLIGESTYQIVADLVDVRPLPPVMVKGKSEPLQVYEVLGEKQALPAPVPVPASKQLRRPA